MPGSNLHTKDELTDIANLFNDMVVKIRMLPAESVKQEKQKQDLKLRLLICTPNTGHPVLGVFLCDTVTSTRRSAWNCTDKGNGQKHQTE